MILVIIEGSTRSQQSLGRLERPLKETAPTQRPPSNDLQVMFRVSILGIVIMVLGTYLVVGYLDPLKHGLIKRIGLQASSGARVREVLGSMRKLYSYTKNLQRGRGAQSCSRWVERRSNPQVL